MDYTDNRRSVGSHIQLMICWIIHTIHNRWSVGSHRQGSKRVHPKGMREAIINLVAHCSTTMMRMMKMDSGDIAWGCIIIIIISSSNLVFYTQSTVVVISGWNHHHHHIDRNGQMKMAVKVRSLMVINRRRWRLCSFLSC